MKCRNYRHATKFESNFGAMRNRGRFYEIKGPINQLCEVGTVQSPKAERSHHVTIVIDGLCFR